MQLPSNLRYTKDHEWAKADGNIITVGITQHAQEALGDVVFVELPQVGRELKQGETFGVVESIKAVSDLYSPLEGKVVEVNQALNDNPALVNQDSYGKAWIVKLEVKNPSTVEELMTPSDYEKHITNS